MTRDFTISLILIGLGVIIATTRQVSPGILEMLLALTRPGATILLLSGVVWLYYTHHQVSAIVASVLVVTLLRALWTTYPNSEARRLRMDISRDVARFDPSTSIDLQFANGTATHDAPSLLVKPWNPSMLVFPPSDATLAAMSGS